MITTSGKIHIKRYLAGLVPSIGSAISFGPGGKAEAVGDTGLQFEVDRVIVDTLSYDFVNDRLIFKAPVPETLAGTIYEVGLFYGTPPAGTKILALFDSTRELWTDATLATLTHDATNTRVGANSLSLVPSASATLIGLSSSNIFNLENNSGSDTFQLAYNATANVSSIIVRLKTDDSNYYSITLPASSVGYNIGEVLKSSAVSTGTPTWSNVTTIEVEVTATAGGTATVDFDAFKIKDTSSQSDYIMVARELLPIPVVKAIGKVQEIEFTLDVNV